MSRVSGCYGFSETVKTQAAATILVDAMVLTISEHGGPVQAAGTVQERVRP